MSRPLLPAKADQKVETGGICPSQNDNHFCHSQNGSQQICPPQLDFHFALPKMATAFTPLKMVASKALQELGLLGLLITFPGKLRTQNDQGVWVYQAAVPSYAPWKKAGTLMRRPFLVYYGTAPASWATSRPTKPPLTSPLPAFSCTLKNL